MKSRRFEPPTCHVCGKLLEAVYENEYWTYSFDETTGTYKGDIVDIEIRCPDCNASVRDQFTKGACNYHAEIPNRT
jgi:hypothetical protein